MRAARVLLASLLAYVALEELIFHSGLYTSIASRDSGAGILDTFLDNERRRPLGSPNQVLTIGNSRMAFFPRVANQLKPEIGYAFAFASIAVAGTTPRCWYYMLREIDPHRNRYSAVVIGLDNYDDMELLEGHADRDLDVRLIGGRLGVRDLPEFAGSYETWAHKWPAIRGILFKGTAYSQDIQDFIKNPAARLASVALSRRDSHNWFYDFVGTSSTMEGVSIDWTTRTMTVPPDRTPAQKRAYEQTLLDPLPPDRGRHEKYMHLWMGKIYELYRGSRTRLVFVRLPRGPLVRPDFPPTKPHSSVRELASRGEATLLEEHLFDSLEHPEFFADELHLNNPGFEQFSATLAREVRRLLGPPR
jgi:hypothetical protein